MGSKALAQYSLALLGRAVRSHLVPELCARPLAKVHLRSRVARKPPAAAKSRSHILNQHHRFFTFGRKRLRALIDVHFIADQTLLRRLVITVLHECCDEFQSIFFIARPAVQAIEFLPAPALSLLTNFIHLVTRKLAHDGCRIKSTCLPLP